MSKFAGYVHLYGQPTELLGGKVGINEETPCLRQALLRAALHKNKRLDYHERVISSKIIILRLLACENSA